MNEYDVVIYGEKTFLHPSSAIVDHVEDGCVYIKAYRHQFGEWVEVPPTSIYKDHTPRPHPNADKVWAEYCAYQLTKGSEDA